MNLSPSPVPVPQTVCKHCGKPCTDSPCIDCRYRGGGAAHDDLEPQERDTVELMGRARIGDGITSDQLQQVSPSER